jgi:hypothetical protein
MRASPSLAFVRRHGIVLESARGGVSNLAEAIAGKPIRGSWWGHAKGHEIFLATRAIRRSPDILICRLVGGKITYVHRRLWPALVRLAPHFRRAHLAAVTEVHTKQGRHVVRVVPFPRWVPPEVKRRADKLSEAAAEAVLARAQLGPYVVTNGIVARDADGHQED